MSSNLNVSRQKTLPEPLHGYLPRRKTQRMFTSRMNCGPRARRPAANQAGVEARAPPACAIRHRPADLNENDGKASLPT